MGIFVRVLPGLAALVGLTGWLALAVPIANAQSQLGIDDGLRRSDRGWAVGFSEWAAGCLATGTYSGGTTIWLGISAKFGFYVAFTNPEWQSIQPRSNYRIEVKTRGRGKNWNGEFTGFAREKEKGVIISGLKRDFLEDFARASGFVVLLEGRQIANVSLSGSREALMAVLDCQNVHKARADAIAAANKQQPDNRKKRVVSSGTGFFVSTVGHVLTNQHVVRGCSVFRVGAVGALLEPAKLLAADARNDLALLKTELKPAQVPGFRARARIGESVSVFGFPLSGTLATTGNFTVGHLSATAGIDDDTRMYQISAPIQPGNSGGPLVDQSGHVIGVIVSKLNVLYALKQNNDIPQNVNFAIKAPIAINFLESNGINPKEVAAGKALEQAEIAELSRGFTLRIECESQ